MFIKDRGEHPRNKVTEEGHIESGIKWTGLIFDLIYSMKSGVLCSGYIHTLQVTQADGPCSGLPVM